MKGNFKNIVGASSGGGSGWQALLHTVLLSIQRACEPW